MHFGVCQLTKDSTVAFIVAKIKQDSNVLSYSSFVETFMAAKLSSIHQSYKYSVIINRVWTQAKKLHMTD